MSRSAVAWFWVRWSFRDLRARWVQVAAIALIIAIGAGAYAGLSSTTRWRANSNRASYEQTSMYDLRARLNPGAFVPEGTFLRALTGIPHADSIARADERLTVPTQVRAAGADGEVLVPGRLFGIDASTSRHVVAGPYIRDGRALRPADAGADVALVEYNFAREYGLSRADSLIVSGSSVSLVGEALLPEYFSVISDSGAFHAQSNFAVIVSPLATVQRITGHPNAVNDVVICVGVDADVRALRDEIAAALAPMAANVTLRAEDPSYRQVTSDVEADQDFWDVFALAVFLSATFAAFNLSSRMMDAQRREIGIAMALGASPLQLTLRPMLVAAEIAALGVVLGIMVGVAVGVAFGRFMEAFLPLPAWETPFQPDLFLIVALIGMSIPVVATLYPVWQATRVPPVAAISIRVVAAPVGRLQRYLRVLRVPGDTVTAMPLRNLLRAPRRVILTMLALTATLSVLLGVLGMIDSFDSTVSRGMREVLGAHPGRAVAHLQRPVPLDSDALAAIGQAEGVQGIDPTLILPGSLKSASAELEISLQFIDFDSPWWRPTLIGGTAPSEQPGIVIAEKAARDLHLAVGDLVTVTLPLMSSDGTFAFTEERVPILALHPHPFRSVAYADIGHARFVGMQGLVNTVYVTPEAAISPPSVTRSLMAIPVVSSTEPLSALADTVRALIQQMVDVLRIVEVLLLLLVILIAYNTVGISLEERRREYATMLAFGVGIWPVLRIAVIENIVLGVLASTLGLAGGRLFLEWIITALVPRVVPEVSVTLTASPQTLILVVAVGIVLTALAPVLTLRRLARIDLPSTLRVVE